MTIRLLVVDDDALVRAGIRLLLAGSSDIEVAGEADDGDRVVDAVRARSPHVVLMDVRMPRLDGVSALRELRARVEKPPAVLMLTTFGADPVIVDALRAGASGFLLKHEDPERLIAAIRSAAAGEAAVSPDILSRIMRRVAEDEGARGDPADGSMPGGDPGEGAGDRLAVLTDRERDVAYAVADGLGNPEIAERLYLSMGTVKAHISSALAKLGVDNRVQLAVIAHDSRRRRA